jgi:glycosyltransferase involved in cell wall biosynthesis
LSLSSSPLVSVVMSMRNSAATIEMAIRSIQLQTLQEWELVLIDDGSTDESSSIVGGIDDRRIRLVKETATAGLAARLNQAVALSRGTFIARMDADDVCFPRRLALQSDRLRRQADIDVIGCGAAVFADDLRLLGELPVGLTHADITAQPLRGFPFPHPTWCGRAEWFRNNPYDVRLTRTQDQDLLLRTFKSSRFAALDIVLVGYRQDALELGKLLSGRRTFIASLWNHARRSRDFLPALDGVMTHCLRGGVDIATVGLGLNGLAQRSRLNSVRPGVTEQWRELQAELGLLGEAA